MKLRGRVWKFGDHVGADHFIAPKYDLMGRKGQYAELSTHILEEADPSFVGSVRPGDILLAGWGFGSGKHLGSLIGAFRHLGIGAIIARSFAAAWERASINAGLPAIVDGHLQEVVAQGEALGLDLVAGVATRADGSAVPMDPLAPVLIEILQAGGIEALTLQRLARAAGSR